MLDQLGVSLWKLYKAAIEILFDFVTKVSFAFATGEQVDLQPYYVSFLASNKTKS